MRWFSWVLCIFIALPAVAKTLPHGKAKKTIPAYKRGQQQPDPKRILEIQQALLDKGYTTSLPTGVWDKVTQDILFKIADDMEWQVDNVPDARVLILLGLGNPFSDPAVAQMKGNILDAWQRKEYYEKHPKSPNR